MKIIAISADEDICIGLRLVGIECHMAKNEDELIPLLENLHDTDMIVISNELTLMAAVIGFVKANPQMLITTLGRALTT